MPELITYQTYASAAEAQDVADLLTNEGINAVVVKSIPRLDVIIGKEYGDKYLLRIPENEFTHANSILFADAHIDVASIDPDHPLLVMSDDELRDIIAKPDEWGADNYRIALALLKYRGVDVSDQTLSNLQAERIQQLSQRKPFSPLFIFIGYVSSLFPFVLAALRFEAMHAGDRFGRYNSWYFPGLLGFIISWTLLKSTTTLPDGRRVPVYNDTAIKHGRVILVCSIISVIINIALYMSLFV